MTIHVFPDFSWRWQLLVIILVVAWLIWLLAPVLTPFTVAAILAYLGNPMVSRLGKIGMSRTMAVSTVFVLLILVFAGVVLLLIPLIVHQMEKAAQNFPYYIAWIRRNVLSWLQRELHLGPQWLNSDHLMAMFRAHFGSIGSVLGKLSRSGVSAVMWLANLVLIPVAAFYLLRDWNQLMAWVDQMLPRSVKPVVVRLARESDVVLWAFVRGQLMVMLSLGLFYGLSLSLVGILLAALIGMMAGLLSFVPYLGFIVGFGAALITAMMQYGDWKHVLMIIAVFTAGQLLESYVLVPRLVGAKIGLHPVMVMFAVLSGGYLFGFLGILLALPMASVILVLLRHLGERYRQSRLYEGLRPGTSGGAGTETIGAMVASDDKDSGSTP